MSLVSHLDIMRIFDTNVQTTKETEHIIAKQGVQEEKKPKRKITKPTYLNDYM